MTLPQRYLPGFQFSETHHLAIRMHCPDAGSRRRFTPCWWLPIRPASGFIRRRGLERVEGLVEQPAARRGMDHVR